MTGHEEESVDDFVEETRSLLGLAPKDEKKPKKPTGLNEQIIKEHARRLLNARENKASFEAAIGKLKDARVQMAELTAIANRYLNEPTGGTFEFEFKSEDAAYRAIKRMFVDRAQDESKARIIKRMTG